MGLIKRMVVAGALGSGLLLGAGVARDAQACGGLFCSSATPVNQAAERIIFSFDRPAKKVTAVVEILYQGPAEKFAWVLPVPGIPTVGVSTSSMLDRLQQLTNPTYQVQRTWGDTCANENARPPSASAPGANAGSGAMDPSAPSVSVLAAGSVGPYVYEVIKVDPAMADAAIVALNWLMTNGYDVGALGADVLRPYLRDGLNLLAFKLAKNKMAGSIRPIMLTYESNHPMIPIRPTAVAAQPDMGILAFVLGAARAVPTNYKSLELNEAMINWFSPSATYNAVVSAAADEAQGQGFVTEMAGPTSNPNTGNFANMLYQESNSVQSFRAAADSLAPGELIVRMVQSFATFAQNNFGGPFGSRPSGGRMALDGVADVIATQLKLPPGVTADDVLASPRCYFAELREPNAFYCDGKPVPQQTIDLTGFDKRAFLTQVEELVIQPLEKTAKLFADQPYMTRFYTTMSALEMTLDPEFDLNDELGDVSNSHNLPLKYTTGCRGDTSGPWEAIIGGLIVRGMGNTWPYDLSMGGQKMPFNRRVVQLMVKGPPVVVADNTAVIAQSLGGAQPGAVPAAPGAPGATPPSSDSGGCAFAGANPSGAAGASLLLVSLLALLRRRRR